MKQLYRILLMCGCLFLLTGLCFAQKDKTPKTGTYTYQTTGGGAGMIVLIKDGKSYNSHGFYTMPGSSEKVYWYSTKNAKFKDDTLKITYKHGTEVEGSNVKDYYAKNHPGKSFSASGEMTLKWDPKTKTLSILHTVGSDKKEVRFEKKGIIPLAKQ